MKLLWLIARTASAKICRVEAKIDKISSTRLVDVMRIRDAMMLVVVVMKMAARKNCEEGNFRVNLLKTKMELRMMVNNNNNFYCCDEK